MQALCGLKGRRSGRGVCVGVCISCRKGVRRTEMSRKSADAGCRPCLWVKGSRHGCVPIRSATCANGVVNSVPQQTFAIRNENKCVAHLHERLLRAVADLRLLLDHGLALWGLGAGQRRAFIILLHMIL